MTEPEDPDLPERERSHVRQRDRKRETRMVVDNAGVKRLQSVVGSRRRSPPAQPRSRPDADGAPGAGQP